MAGEGGCYPWLIPAGKLVSAHRAWRPTLHGGWVSGGRQWGVAGLPAWWVTLPGQCVTLHGHSDDVWFRVMPDTQTCINYLIIQMILMQDSENMIRHHQNGYWRPPLTHPPWRVGLHARCAETCFPRVSNLPTLLSHYMIL